MQQAHAFFNSDVLNDEQGAKDFVASFLFTAAQPQFSNANSLAEIGLFALQGVYIDNSQSPGSTSLQMQGSGSRQNITVAPYTQGFYRLLGSPIMLDYSVTNFSGGSLDGGGPTPVTIHFLNIMPAGAVGPWESQSPQEEIETPIAGSANTANAPAVVTFAAVAGRRTYVSGIALSGSGSTAGLAVNATLTNVDNGGVAQTLNFAFVFPIGVLVAAVPVVVAFSPPLEIIAGANAVLTLPAGGANNTNETATMTGQLV
jgi:hypothetical protein